MDFPAIPTETESLGRFVVDAGIKVHCATGPGLLESAYEHCLAHELRQRGVDVLRQVVLPVHYAGAKLDAGYRIDLLIGRAVIVEVKSVDCLAAIHQAQLLTYLRLSNCRLGYLINFNVSLFKEGIKRFVL
jgi:GxxExxY protein